LEEFYQLVSFLYLAHSTDAVPHTQQWTGIIKLTMTVHYNITTQWPYKMSMATKSLL